jgi:uncharacterized membrane protein
MKVASAIVSVFALALATGCMPTSPQGGGLGKDNGFTIGTPMFGVTMKQMETRAVKVELKRGKFFMQDVRLESRATEGLKIEPAEMTVKASEPGEVYLRVTAPENAAIGEYRIYVKGVPESGETTTGEIKVKVTAP